jgi:HSP20 family molecular chaperone IbpA
MYTTLLNSLINQDSLATQKSLLKTLENYNYDYVLTTKKDDSYVTKFNVAGFEKNEIKIEFTKKVSGYTRQVKIIAQNEEFGTLRLFSEVPSSIDEKTVKATLKNGILTILCNEEKVKSPLASLTIQVE